ncbi:hypothetical protein [Mesorhizobium sp. 2RAF21]|uniref:hypothetical protein n=1 Tax=Mesorhizobium sp. 2RAF21 TaxID=3232995 RepID=UPI003F9DBECC
MDLSEAMQQRDGPDPQRHRNGRRPAVVRWLAWNQAIDRQPTRATRDSDVR